MKRRLPFYLCIYVLIFGVIIAFGAILNNSISVFCESTNIQRLHTFVIDAGHGEPDGGATSCTGVLESEINLAIAHRLNDLMHLLGMQTVMIRSNENSVYTDGKSIASKKVSDLKQRLKIIEETDNAVLVSIHQNHFADDRYSGAQVFFASTENSAELAKKIQERFRTTINPTSKRQPKKAENVYLMQHIKCTGILIECGFLSNPQEEYKLRDKAYQKQLAGIIATELSQYFYAP